MNVVNTADNDDGAPTWRGGTVRNCPDRSWAHPDVNLIRFPAWHLFVYMEASPSGSCPGKLRGG